MADQFEQAGTPSEHQFGVEPVAPPEPAGMDLHLLRLGHLVAPVLGGRSRLEQLRADQAHARIAWMTMDNALGNLEAASASFEAHMSAQQASFVQGSAASTIDARMAHGRTHHAATAMAVEGRYRVASDSIGNIDRGATQLINLSRGTNGYNTLGADPETIQAVRSRAMQLVVYGQPHFVDRDVRALGEALRELPVGSTARSVVARSMYQAVLARGLDNLERYTRGLTGDHVDRKQAITQARHDTLVDMHGMLSALGTSDAEVAAVHATMADALLWPVSIYLQPLYRGR